MYAVRRGIDPDEGAIEAGSIGRRQRSPVDPGVEPASSTRTRDRPSDRLARGRDVTIGVGKRTLATGATRRGESARGGRRSADRRSRPRTPVRAAAPSRRLRLAGPPTTSFRLTPALLQFGPVTRSPTAEPGTSALPSSGNGTLARVSDERTSAWSPAGTRRRPDAGRSPWRRSNGLRSRPSRWTRGVGRDDRFATASVTNL